MEIYSINSRSVVGFGIFSYHSIQVYSYYRFTIFKYKIRYEFYVI